MADRRDSSDIRHEQFVNEVCLSGDRGPIEEGHDGWIYLEALADPIQQSHCEHRVAAEVKEAVLY